MKWNLFNLTCWLLTELVEMKASGQGDWKSISRHCRSDMRHSDKDVSEVPHIQHHDPSFKRPCVLSAHVSLRIQAHRIAQSWNVSVVWQG